MTPKAFEPMDPQVLERDTIMDDYKRTVETLCQWQAIARRLGKVLGGISVRCGGVHHRKDQRHELDEPCPVEAEIRAALDELERMEK